MQSDTRVGGSVLFRILAVRGQIHYLVKRKRKNRLRASRASTHAPKERLVARRAQPVAVAQRARRCLAGLSLARAALPLEVGGLTAHSFAGRNGAFQREYLLKHTAEGASSETQIDQVNDDCTRQLRVLLAAGLLAAP